jgi:hypothetical protein
MTTVSLQRPGLVQTRTAPFPRLQNNQPFRVSLATGFETPFMRGGESLAHREIARRFRIAFEELQLAERALASNFCRTVIFRVVSIGRTIATGISNKLASRSCRMHPYNVSPKQFLLDNDNCTAREYLL